MINRLILIGNGFDLAHGLKTSYQDFLYWYWQDSLSYQKPHERFWKDCFFSLELNGHLTLRDFFFNGAEPMGNGKDIEKKFYSLCSRGDVKIWTTPLFGQITRCIEIKGWTDIEREYYQLLLKCSDDKSLRQLQDELDTLCTALIWYLEHVATMPLNDLKPNEKIRNLLLEGIRYREVAVGSRKPFKEIMHQRIISREFYKLGHLTSNERSLIEESLDRVVPMYNLKKPEELDDTDMHLICQNSNKYLSLPEKFFIPRRLFLLNFNYTKTVEIYNEKYKLGYLNYIHGRLTAPKSVIFGYGDEIDSGFGNLHNLNNNEYLKNIKSIRYLESSKYRNILTFIESCPYQIYIMGHSCGISDRTLLNTLFEHKNCISIKPFYYQKKDGTDNYIDIVENISRNFTDMKLMRDRVVNKEFCEPLGQFID